MKFGDGHKSRIQWFLAVVCISLVLISQAAFAGSIVVWGDRALPCSELADIFFGHITVNNERGFW